jgi:hypothetical protein
MVQGLQSSLQMPSQHECSHLLSHVLQLANRKYKTHINVGCVQNSVQDCMRTFDREDSFRDMGA